MYTLSFCIFSIIVFDVWNFFIFLLFCPYDSFIERVICIFYPCEIFIERVICNRVLKCLTTLIAASQPHRSFLIIFVNACRNQFSKDCDYDEVLFACAYVDACVNCVSFSVDLSICDLQCFRVLKNFDFPTINVLAVYAKPHPGMPLSKFQNEKVPGNYY